MNVQQLYERGEAHLQAGAWLPAAQAFQAVVERLPQHGCAHHLLGKAQVGLGAMDAAEALQRRSCALDPGLGWNWFALGELCQQRGALQEAQEAFEQAGSALPQQRWILERARRLERRLTWEQTRQLPGEPRFGLEALVQIVWQLRPDLRERFTGEPEAVRLWLLLEGAEEYLAAVVLRDSLLEVFRPLAEQPAPLPDLFVGALRAVQPPISQLLLEIWHQQEDLQRRFDLDTLAGRVGLFWWYVIEAVDRHQLQALLCATELAYLQEPVDPNASVPVMRLAQAARRFAGQEVNDVGVLEPQRCDGVIQAAAWREPLGFGVNVIGYAQGQLGIGEDLRMAVQALDAAGVPCSVYNVQPDASIDCQDHSVSGRVTRQLPYRFNLFCLTGIETARVAVTDYLPMMLPGYVNIGYWPWEFARWPAHWRVAYHMVDEVWASTRFTADAYRSDGVVPVELMPMLVDVSATGGRVRADFGLPSSRFLFIFSFYCGSSLRRKNPWGVIEAFQRAFPLADGADVGLVVKVMRGNPKQAAYRRLLQRARADARITLMEDTLPREVLLDLYRACDAYVSLHRCEGFGRGIAEAMLLGKPVIATAYSGNLDFCTQDTALLVPAALRKVLPGDYPEAQGMDWAEPDVEAAAEAMRRCALAGWKPEGAAVQRMADTYSAQRVGHNYRQRLECLAQ